MIGGIANSCYCPDGVLDEMEQPSGGLEMNDQTNGDWDDLCTRFGIDAATIERRRNHVALGPEDDQALAEICAALPEIAEKVVVRFYEHLLAQPDLRGELGGDSEIEALKGTLRAYLMGLGQGSADPAYFESRLRVGLVHEAKGLLPRHVMESFAVLFDALAEQFEIWARAQGKDAAPLVRSLAKFMWLDASLGVEAYQEAAASRMQSVVERAQEAEGQLREASAIDELTGIANRRELMSRLEVEFDRSRRYEIPFVLLFADLDLFKRVNDERGHEAGDAVLKDIANRLREGTRPADVVGRYGGEEFVIGLVQTPLDRAVKIAERLRRAIALQPVNYGDEPVSMTISIGVAPLRDTTPDLAALLVEADAALYRAKRQGRNAVCQDAAVPKDE